MRTLILAGAMACCSGAVYANQCDMEFSGQLHMQDKVLQVTMADNSKMTIYPDNTLYVDGNQLDLTPTQQQWVQNYYTGVNTAVPQAAGIATDAVALASDALNQVFTELLGADNQALADLSHKLRELDNSIQYSFYADNGEIRLDSDSFEDGEFFGEQWESHFEDAVEELVTQSIGQLMVAVGTQIIFGGGDTDEFEEKMERFGQQIEDTVEFQSERLEEKAEQLCETLQDIDFAESQLQKQVSELVQLDVIQIDSRSNLM